MYKRLCDGILYNENLERYGNWNSSVNSDGTFSCIGDNDISKLPTNIPYGSTALTNNGQVYQLKTNSQWVLLG